MAALGCLILHGFKSNSDSVNRMAQRLDPYGIPYCMPVLRGHGTRPEDLRGVTWHDWYSDATVAFNELRGQADQIVVVGHSMGGLLALHLAAARAAEVVGVVTIGAALRFADRLAPYARFLAPIKPMVGSDKRDRGLGWADPELGRQHTSYQRFPTRSFVSLWHYAQVVEQQLKRVHAPLLIIHSRVDRTIPPAAATALYDLAASEQKELVWFERSGHEMLRDSEAAAVLDRIEAFILARQTALETEPGFAAKE